MNRTGSKPGRTLNRPRTRFFCRWVPKRTSARRFSRRDAARVCCYVLSGAPNIAGSSFTMGAIIQEMKSICPDAPIDPEFSVENQAVAEASMAVSALEENNNLLEQILKILAILNAALLALQAAALFVPVPAVRLVALGIRPARTQIQTAQQIIIGRKAANDAVIEQFRNIREAQIKLAA